MSDNWDFYFLRVDDDPASIYLDLDLAQASPIQSQPHMAYVRVPMRSPRPDGLSSNEEFDALIAVEDSLTERFATQDNTTYVGRNTSGGNRDFYFYTDDPAAFAATVETAMAHHPRYEAEIGARLDPEWSVYFGFLYPSPDDLQRIHNRRVISKLEEHGDDLTAPRSIDHMAYFSKATGAEQLRTELLQQGFTLDEPRIVDGLIAVAFNRSDQPNGIDDVVIPLARRVQELGGDYDGWGCEVVTMKH